MKTGLICFRVVVIGFALFQVGSAAFAAFPLIEMGAMRMVFTTVAAAFLGAVAGCFMVLYPVELLYRTYEISREALYLNRSTKAQSSEAKMK